MATDSGADRALVVWLPIPGLEGRYEVSREGDIRSVGSDKVRSAYRDSDGYLRVSVHTVNGPRSISVHRAVAKAFHGHRRNVLHCEVAHVDGDRANPRAGNLKWVSKVENMSHKRRHGTAQAGEKHPRAKLTDEQVRTIRTRYANSKETARDFGISRHAVFDIWQGKRWAHVE